MNWTNSSFVLLLLTAVCAQDEIVEETTNYPPSIVNFFRTKRLRQFVDPDIKQEIMDDPICADLKRRIQILTRAVPKFNGGLQQGFGDLNSNTRKKIMGQFTTAEAAHFDEHCGDNAAMHKQFQKWINAAMPFSPYCEQLYNGFMESGMARKPVSGLYRPFAKMMAKFVVRKMSEDMGSIFNGCNPRKLFCAYWNQAIMDGTQTLSKDELRLVGKCSHHPGQQKRLKAEAHATRFNH